MSSGILWTVNYQVQGRYIRAAAALAGLQIDLPEAYTHFEDNKKPEFLAKFPHGKIPAWEGTDSFLLTESYAIARYSYLQSLPHITVLTEYPIIDITSVVSSLAPNSNLLGTSPQETALIDQWSFFASSEIGVYTNFSLYLLKGVTYPYNKAIHQKFIESEKFALNTLNSHLASRTYLVGERITLADLVVAATVQRAFFCNVGAAERAGIPHVVRFIDTIVNQPTLRSIFEGAEYVERARQYIPPPKERKDAKD